RVYSAWEELTPPPRGGGRSTSSGHPRDPRRRAWSGRVEGGAGDGRDRPLAPAILRRRGFAVKGAGAWAASERLRGAIAIRRLTAVVCVHSIRLTAGLARSARQKANVRCACGSSGGGVRGRGRGVGAGARGRGGRSC